MYDKKRQLLWHGTFLFGAAAMTPLTGMGHRGRPWQELIATLGFASLGMVIVAALVLILWGLRRNARD
jgi:hydroxylaminobenzene mutase